MGGFVDARLEVVAERGFGAFALVVGEQRAKARAAGAAIAAPAREPVIIFQAEFRVNRYYAILVKNHRVHF